MNNYESYREVQSFWMDKVPSHWKSQKNKHIFTQKKEIVGDNWGSFTLLTMGKGGVKPRDMDGGGKFPESFEGYQVVNPEQLIFCLFDLDETPRTVGLSKDHGMITSAYDVFSTQEGNDPQYWNYFYQTIDDHKGLRPYYTGLRKVVRYDTFMGIEVYSPPFEEQRIISCYLDKKTNQIDSLISKIEKKIDLLKEQRTSLIDQCVTKGIDLNVQMKDCGVEWIGKIPNHWEISKIKYVSQLENGSTPKSDNAEYWDGSIKWFTPTDFKNKDEFGYIQNSSRMITHEGLNNSGCSLVEGTSLLMTTRAPVGNLAKIDGPFTFNQGCKSLTPTQINLDYLYFYLLTRSETLNVLSNGTTFKELPTDNLLNFELPLPPSSEQFQIAKFLTATTTKTQKLISLLNSKKTVALEYRQSLISSVVTGRVRVTEDMV